MCSHLSGSCEEACSWEERVERILRLAWEVGRCYPALVALELAQEAVGHVYEHLGSFCPQRGTFEAWCRTSLTHLGVDLFRKWRRHARITSPEVLAVVATTEEVLTIEKQTEAIEEDLEQLRSCLDDLCKYGKEAADTRDGGEEIDYYGVLVLHLRLVLACRASRVLKAERIDIEGGLVDFISRRLPWRSDEERRRFRDSDPTLGELWNALAGDIDCQPCRGINDRLCRLLSDLGGEVVSKQRWATWCQRARDWACRVLGPTRWERVFGSWLHGDRPRPRVAAVEE
jgi:hypothetical protein